MTTNPFKGLVLLIAAVLLVAGCDGGDGKLAVPDLAPVARFTATPDGGTAPLPVQFDATSSSDGGDTIARYLWVFGDGSPQGSGVTTSHVYEVAGTYNVTLWVTDQKGVGRSTTRQISVRPVAPTLAFSVSPTTLGAGEAATLSWEAQAATSCVASGGWTGARPVSGSAQTAPMSVSTTFTLNCSGPGGEVSQSVTVQVNVVGGQLLVPAISRADSDVNDPAAPYRSNDTADEAQVLPNPVIVGGYLNEPGRGPVGRSSASGDLDDVYKVTSRRARSSSS
jgi:PKD repeat protein